MPLSMEDVRNWEEAGVRLECAVADFLHSSRKLEQSTVAHSIDVANLPLRLDRRIEHFRALLTDPLAESLACVTRTRNALLTPIYRLQPEILQNIFELAVTGPTSDLSFETAVRTNCLCLYRIISVCSVWRKVAISHAPLWTLVPLVFFKDRPRVVSGNSAKLSIERAGRSDLRLVALIGEYRLSNSSSSWDLLTENGHRFRSIDIRSTDLYSLERVLGPILETAEPGSISELSLYCDSSRDAAGQTDPRYLFQHTTEFWSQQSVFESILKSIRVLRLEKVLLRPDNISLSNLVALRIAYANFGPESAFRQFLLTLSTASRLETLDIISIFAYDDTPQPFVKNRSISLPSLQTIYLDHVSCNIIRTVLSTIRPGTHRITLSLSNWSLVTRLQHDQVITGIESLIAAISSHTLDTLEITSSFLGDAENLRSLLMTQPKLTTIHVRDPDFDYDFFETLTRPADHLSRPNRFAKLRRIYLVNHTIGNIRDTVAFKAMLSSHPVEELVLHKARSEEEELEASEFWGNTGINSTSTEAMELESWLRAKIPRFRLLESGESCMVKSWEEPLW